MTTPQESPKKSDAERSFDEIRREVIESRNLVIKTDNLLKSLHAELKTVSKRQEDFEKKTLFSSAAAYVLLAGLCLGLSYFYFSARGATEVADRKRVEAQLTEARAELQKVQASQASAARNKTQAMEVHRQLLQARGEQRLKAVEAYKALDATLLSDLEKWALSDRATALSQELGQSSFERGKAAFRRNEYSLAVQDLERFLSLNPSEEEALDAQFFLGAAYSQMRKPQQVILHLAKFVEKDKKSKTRDYAMLLLSQAYEQTQQFEKAIEVARAAIAAYPASEFLPGLKARLSAGKKTGEAPTVSPVPAKAPDAGAAAAPTPAPAPAAAKPAEGGAEKAPAEGATATPGPQ